MRLVRSTASNRQPRVFLRPSVRPGVPAQGGFVGGAPPTHRRRRGMWSHGSVVPPARGDARAPCCASKSFVRNHPDRPFRPWSPQENSLCHKNSTLLPGNSTPTSRPWCIVNLVVDSICAKRRFPRRARRCRQARRRSRPRPARSWRVCSGSRSRNSTNPAEFEAEVCFRTRLAVQRVGGCGPPSGSRNAGGGAALFLRRLDGGTP